jgi:hypothetical protein
MHHPDHRLAPTVPERKTVAVALWRMALVAVAVSGAALLTAPAAFGQVARYEAAQADYEIGHFDRAFTVFASLADEGHCDAARLAQQMARYGRPLYASEFKVAPDRLARWQRLPGCPVRLAGGDTQRRAP